MPRSKGVSDHQGFYLDLAGTGIPWAQLPSLGYFAIYTDFPERGSKLAVVRGRDKLRGEIELWASKQMLPNRVWIETAKRKNDLPNPEYARTVRRVFEGIEIVKKTGDTATLRRIRAALVRRGLKPGPKATRRAWMMELLKDLASGKALKEAVQPPRKPSAASAQISRFCYEFYEWCHVWLKAETPTQWRQPRIAKILRDRTGVSIPNDIAAAQEAYRRGKIAYEKVSARADALRITTKFSFAQIQPPH